MHFNYDQRNNKSFGNVNLHKCIFQGFFDNIEIDIKPHFAEFFGKEIPETEDRILGVSAP